MEDRPLTSTSKKLFSIAFLSILTLSSLAWFIISINLLVSQFHTSSPIIGFDKGSMYMLGIGFGLLFLTIGGVTQGLLQKKLTPRHEAFFTRALIINLLVTIAFPQLAHYTVARYAQKQGYNTCDDFTYRWLLYSKSYYTKHEIFCSKIINNKPTIKNQHHH